MRGGVSIFAGAATFFIRTFTIETALVAAYMRGNYKFCAKINKKFRLDFTFFNA